MTLPADLVSFSFSPQVPCTAGQYTPDSGQVGCTNCAIGTASSDSGRTTECDQCLRGRYQSETGATLCLPCSPGEFQNISGATTCHLCEEATYFGGKARNRTCEACPIGWSSAVGSTKCQACEAGTFGAGCQACPLGYARNGADQDATQCRHCKLGETTTLSSSASCERW